MDWKKLAEELEPLVEGEDRIFIERILITDECEDETRLKTIYESIYGYGVD